MNASRVPNIAFSNLTTSATLDPKWKLASVSLSKYTDGKFVPLIQFPSTETENGKVSTVFVDWEKATYALGAGPRGSDIITEFLMLMKCGCLTLFRRRTVEG